MWVSAPTPVSQGGHCRPFPSCGPSASLWLAASWKSRPCSFACHRCLFARGLHGQLLSIPPPAFNQIALLGQQPASLCAWHNPFHSEATPMSGLPLLCGGHHSPWQPILMCALWAHSCTTQVWTPHTCTGISFGPSPPGRADPSGLVLVCLGMCAPQAQRAPRLWQCQEAGGGVFPGMGLAKGTKRRTTGAQRGWERTRRTRI